MIKANERMKNSFLKIESSNVSMDERLEQICTLGIFRGSGFITLNHFCSDTESIHPDWLSDQTGFECTINSFHISDYANSDLYEQAFLFIKCLYEMCHTCKCRIILSDNEGDLVVRFHKLRSGEIWLDEDLESYSSEGVLLVDTAEDYIFPSSFKEFQKSIM